MLLKRGRKDKHPMFPSHFWTFTHASLIKAEPHGQTFHCSSQFERRQCDRYILWRRCFEQGEQNVKHIRVDEWVLSRDKRHRHAPTIASFEQKTESLFEQRDDSAGKSDRADHHAPNFAFLDQRRAEKPLLVVCVLWIKRQRFWAETERTGICRCVADFGHSSSKRRFWAETNRHSLDPLRILEKRTWQKDIPLWSLKFHRARSQPSTNRVIVFGEKQTAQTWQGPSEILRPEIVIAVVLVPEIYI